MLKDAKVMGKQLRDGLESIINIDDNIDMYHVVECSGGIVFYDKNIKTNASLELLKDKRFIIRLNPKYTNKNNEKIIIAEKYVIWFFFTHNEDPGVFIMPDNIRHALFVQIVDEIVAEFLLPRKELRKNLYKFFNEENKVDLEKLSNYYNLPFSYVYDRCVNLKLIKQELVS